MMLQCLNLADNIFKVLFMLYSTGQQIGASQPMDHKGLLERQQSISRCDNFHAPIEYLPKIFLENNRMVRKI